MNKKSTYRRIRHVAYAAGLSAVLLCATPALAKTPSTEFEIPSQDLTIALTEFAKQSDMQLMFPPNAVQNRTSGQITGKYNRERALKILLQGTDLEYEFTDQNTVVIRPRDQQSSREQGPGYTEFAQLAPANGASERNATSGQAANAPAQDQSDFLEEITITGTRIQQRGLTTPTPVTSVASGDLDRMAPGNLIESMSQLPAFFNNNDDTVSSGSGVSDAGGAALNLRGLGRNRTLVLLGSRRIGPNNKEGTVNIDVLPSALIERVDIVTGGASASYGTDAVAGVANFVLDTDFTGFKGHVQGGISKKGDHENGEIELTAGMPIGDKMHLILSAEFFGLEGVESGTNREWLRDGWAIMTNPEFAANGTPPRDLIVRRAVKTNITCGGMIIAPGSSLDRHEFNNDGTASPFVLSDLSSTGPGTLETQSLDTQFGGGSGCRPNERHGNTGKPNLTNDQDIARFFSYVDYDFSDNITGFAQFMFSHNELGFGDSAELFNTPWFATAFTENPFLDQIETGSGQSVQDVLEAEGIDSFRFHRFTDDLYQDSSTRLRNRTMAITTGFHANVDSDGFLDGWRMDGYYQFSRNQQRTRFLSKMRWQTIFLALDAVEDPATGNIVCHAALLNPDRFGDCVPINLFGEGNASEAAIRYVTTPGSKDNAVTHRFEISQHDVELSGSGEIWEGFGAGPVAAAIGVSYREQKLTSMETGAGADFEGLTNNILGVRGLPPAVEGDTDIQMFDSFSDVDGSFNVKEAFTELNVPIISDAAFAQSLTGTMAGRWADYSGSGTSWSYKFGLDWQVDNSIRFRGTFSRDVRAATLSERFDSQRTNGRIDNDPVTGLSYNFSQTTGGNPEVDPEKADTFTVGAVYQPSWVDGLGITLDWWRIKLKGGINQIGVQRIVEDCFAGAQQLCELITRDPDTQLIVDLRNVFINVNQEQASGVDLEVNYNTTVDFIGDSPEDLGFRFFGTWLSERSITVPGAPKRDDVGNLNAPDPDSAGFPEFQWTAQVSYNNGPINLWIQERYLHSGKLDNRDVEGVDINDNTIPAVWYTDLRVSYTIESGNGNMWEIFGHITNLFDKDPPRVTGSIGSTTGEAMQTNTFLYDVVGQRFVVGARFRY